MSSELHSGKSIAFHFPAVEEKVCEFYAEKLLNTPRTQSEVLQSQSILRAKGMITSAPELHRDILTHASVCFCNGKVGDVVSVFQSELL